MSRAPAASEHGSSVWPGPPLPLSPLFDSMHTAGTARAPWPETRSAWCGTLPPKMAAPVGRVGWEAGHQTVEGTGAQRRGSRAGQLGTAVHVLLPVRRQLLALKNVSTNLPPDLTAWTWICAAGGMGEEWMGRRGHRANWVQTARAVLQASRRSCGCRVVVAPDPSLPCPTPPPHRHAQLLLLHHCEQRGEGGGAGLRPCWGAGSTSEQ